MLEFQSGIFHQSGFESSFELDYVLSNPPWGKNIQGKISDWIILGLFMVIPKGRLCYIVNDGFLSNEKEKEFRKGLIESGTILGIIKMPNNLFLNTNVSANILVLEVDSNVAFVFTKEE